GLETTTPWSAGFRKKFLPGDHGSAFQVKLIDCHRDDHRPAGTQVPLQCSRDKGQLQLDAANAALDSRANFQPQRVKANAANPRAAGKNRAGLKLVVEAFVSNALPIHPVLDTSTARTFERC